MSQFRWDQSSIGRERPQKVLELGRHAWTDADTRDTHTPERPSNERTGISFGQHPDTPLYGDYNPENRRV
ncbi:hypothetical protein [Natranaeroarchaeum aerophilus]|uniref:Uncharacterized protein n=1 Tax=Natranaeroarchaeum aerophilus TaxID=2917711 RepID=A0AAE3FSK6_9EURY|nr:hypothetical protein [Natranaeroarchaeum aerophilus]MCL9814867.1 hypothetical protein [Natranaeroarchaeum aerophilus]